MISLLLSVQVCDKLLDPLRSDRIANEKSDALIVFYFPVKHHALFTHSKHRV
jgi:hypothetical protein